MNVLKWDSFIWSNLPKISNNMPSIYSEKSDRYAEKESGKKIVAQLKQMQYFDEFLKPGGFSLQWIGERNKTDVSHIAWIVLVWIVLLYQPVIKLCISLSSNCLDVNDTFNLLPKHSWCCVALASCINIPDSQASSIVILPIIRGHRALNLKALYRIGDFTVFWVSKIPEAFCKWPALYFWTQSVPRGIFWNKLQMALHISASNSPNPIQSNNTLLSCKVCIQVKIYYM